MFLLGIQAYAVRVMIWSLCCLFLSCSDPSALLGSPWSHCCTQLPPRSRPDGAYVACNPWAERGHVLAFLSQRETGKCGVCLSARSPNGIKGEWIRRPTVTILFLWFFPFFLFKRKDASLYDRFKNFLHIKYL